MSMNATCGSEKTSLGGSTRAELGSDVLEVALLLGVEPAQVAFGDRSMSARYPLEELFDTCERDRHLFVERCELAFEVSFCKLAFRHRSV
jgi:hypothetical protein